MEGMGGWRWKRCKLAAKSHSFKPHHPFHLQCNSPHSCYLHCHCLASSLWPFWLIFTGVYQVNMTSQSLVWFIPHEWLLIKKSTHMSTWWQALPMTTMMAGLRLFFFHCTPVLTFLHWWVMLQELRGECNRGYNAMHRRRWASQCIATAPVIKSPPTQVLSLKPG